MSNVIVGSSFNNKKEEKAAAATITPGYLIELNSDDEFQNHSTAGGSVVPCFADIDKWQGNDLDDDYSAGDLVAGWYPGSGDVVENAMLDGASANLAIGSFVQSNGDGLLTLYEVAISAGGVVQDRQIVGFALEAVVPDGSDTRFKLQIV
jgi:hypothetical protein